jgi:hypothetical protein
MPFNNINIALPVAARQEYSVTAPPAEGSGKYRQVRCMFADVHEPANDGRETLVSIGTPWAQEGFQ